jgi:hypothetical protein
MSLAATFRAWRERRAERAAETCAECHKPIWPGRGYWDENRRAMYCNVDCLNEQIDRNLY